MRGRTWGGLLCGLLGFFALSACGDDDSPPDGGDGGSAGADASPGGHTSSGGKGSTGGRPHGTGGVGTGGAGLPTGGTASSGGTGTGGTGTGGTGTGGTGTGTGGTTDTGGTPSSGGASPSSGGASPSSGGASSSSGGAPTDDGGTPDGGAGDADVPCGDVAAPCCASQACANGACCNAVSGLCVAASGTCASATCGGSGCTFCTSASFAAKPVAAPSPVLVTAADLDGDGDNDLVVSSTDRFAVLLNDGKGEFTRTDYPFDTQLTTVGVGDVDGDGTADLVFSAPSVNEIVVFLNAGGGTFGGAARYASAGQFPSGNFVVDTDADGHLDVIVDTSEGLKVQKNDGSGAFGSPTVLFATRLNPPHVIDLDGDGRVDVVGVMYGDAPQPFTAYLNLPGGFTRSYDYVLPSNNGVFLVPGDYDGDGDADFILQGSPQSALLLNDGDGTFTASVVTLPNLGKLPQAFNVDGDADSDVLVQEIPYGTAWVYESVGGVLSPPRAFYPTGIADAVAELNGDAKTDLVSYVSNGITVGLSRPDGTYPGFSLASSHATASFPFGIVAGDLNGDGLTDVIAPYDSTGLYVSLGTSTGKLGPPVLYPVDPGDSHTLEDLTGDGALDFATSVGGSQDIKVFVNSGTGTFGTTSSIAVGGGARAMASGDVDSDGDADIVAAVRTSTADSLVLLKNDGAGNFAAPAILASSFGARAVLLTDLNADGILDVAVSKLRLVNPLYEGAVQVLLGTGGGNFAPPVEYRGGGHDVYAMTAGDVDNDGDIDMVVGGPDGDFGVDGFLGVLLNAGNGTFTDAVPFPFPSPADTLRIADFNADGWNDLVAVVSGAGMGVLLNRRDGTFAFPEALPVRCGGAAVLDFDGDGRTDILTAAPEGVAVAKGTAECRLR